MKTIFGVYSDIPSNKRLKNGYTMYDWVMRMRGFPLFWGATLMGENPLTADEIKYLREKDCKIALVIRDLTESGVSGVSGVHDALRAIKAAEQLSVPKNEGIALFAEIKPDWSVNHNWMLGFARTLVTNGYVPGFIGNTDSSKNFNFDRQASHYVESSRYANCFGAIFCATEPKLIESPKAWEPFCPSALEPEDMHLWMCSKTKFCNLEVSDVYARDEKVLECMW